MKLPNADSAIIPDDKLGEYCLNIEHSYEQHKAFLFSKLLGITEDNAYDFKIYLKALLATMKLSAFNLPIMLRSTASIHSLLGVRDHLS